ncbi:hypothetical protein VC53_gp15 [Pseudomonas phage vB_PaeP_PAO1_Ab05]|uniref:Uncharacterized protein n=1 Tax=Pseudomonas phage vB_PaeP_PAO1_Ab05 TaxID=1548902 RepID=A0A0A1IUQ5_9CAUD|nr:hypothetical protein VC53_gp15 [Pseudomonas phage vB_PaeP_PAO1_Ab05]CEF89276.1 hypothetical protein [Pseudomonas phage vB_PaeP_PAO1_Ab05]
MLIFKLPQFALAEVNQVLRHVMHKAAGTRRHLVPGCPLAVDAREDGFVLQLDAEAVSVVMREVVLHVRDPPDSHERAL